MRRNRAERPGELERLLGSMVDAKMKRLKGHTTWYLNILAVHPNFQKRGVGKELCLRGMREAENDGVPTYLEASAKGEGMYRSLGWVDIGRMTDDFGVGVIMAWYPPTTTVRFDVE